MTRTAVSHASSIGRARELLRLRSRAALVRALLDELDRVVPSVNGQAELAVGTQLVDELRHLGQSALECAAMMTAAERQTPLEATSDEPRSSSQYFVSDRRGGLGDVDGP